MSWYTCPLVPASDQSSLDPSTQQMISASQQTVAGPMMIQLLQQIQATQAQIGVLTVALQPYNAQDGKDKYRLEKICLI